MDKETLRRYRYLIREINLLEERKRKECDPVSGGFNLIIKTVGRINNPTANAIIKRAKIQRVIDRRLDRLYDLRVEIEEWLAELPSEDAIIIRLRYIDCLTWAGVAEKTNFTTKTVQRKHNQILKN